MESISASPIVGSILFLSTISLCYANTQRNIASSFKWSDNYMNYVDYTSQPMPNTLVVDCSHPTCQQLTHHLKGLKQKQSMDLSLRGDSSTDAVLNAILAKHSSIKNFHKVTANHFDVDSFFSVWCAMNPKLAQENEYLLRECARIGDFRELQLTNSVQDKALRIVCWLNSEERRLFYKPFESTISVADGEEDGSSKFIYFLPLLSDILKNIYNDEIYQLYRTEYERVIKEYNTLHSTKSYQVYQEISLVVVKASQPLHYYSLFSTSLGYDIILSIYNTNQYELEIKYTTMVDIFSRKTLPRIELQYLSKYLNKLENSLDYHWIANRVTDSGPIMRLDKVNQSLTKVERYGHPYERPIYESSINSDLFQEIVISYLTYGYLINKRIDAKKDWTWQEIHDFNKSIDWTKWKSL